MKFGKYEPVDVQMRDTNEWERSFFSIIFGKECMQKAEFNTFKFKNGYGANVSRTPTTYGSCDGLWELAVLKNGRINYKTPITDDVIGWLSEDEVAELLAKIENLPPVKRKKVKKYERN